MVRLCCREDPGHGKTAGWPRAWQPIASASAAELLQADAEVQQL